MNLTTRDSDSECSTRTQDTIEFQIVELQESRPIESLNPSIISLLQPPFTPTKIPKETRTIYMENIDKQNPMTMFPTGNQPPEPLAVISKEIKMNTPTPFTGDKAKLNNFLMEVKMYMWMNSSVYDMHEKKILFMLSFMKDGTAGPWKQSFWNSIDFDNAQDLGSWRDFKRAL